MRFEQDGWKVLMLSQGFELISVLHRLCTKISLIYILILEMNSRTTSVERKNSFCKHCSVDDASCRARVCGQGWKWTRPLLAQNTPSWRNSPRELLLYIPRCTFYCDLNLTPVVLMYNTVIVFRHNYRCSQYPLKK